MKLRFFDFEVYKNWWCCTFGDYPEADFDETIKETFNVVTSDDETARDNLLKFFYEEDVCSAGYNIKGYDLAIANAIRNGFSPPQVRCISDVIINPKSAFDSKEHSRLAPFAKRKLQIPAYQEMMDDSSDGSLKDVEGLLGLDVQETTVPFDTENLTDKQKAQIIYYNKHDVFATMYYHHIVKRDYTDGKLNIGKTFGIPESTCYKSTNAILTAAVLDARYSKFQDEFRSDVVLPPSIRNYIYDAIPNKIVDRILTNPYIFQDEKVSSKTITETLFGQKVDFGNGGLHSVLCKNLYAESDDDYVLVNADVASFYPMIMINFDTLSRAVKDRGRYKQIAEERLALKFKPNKTSAEKDKVNAYKLILNTVFGASGNKYLALYDKYMCLTTCRLGQLILAALGCKMYKGIPGLKVVQTNTDGILVYLKRSLLPKLKEIGAEFEKVMGMALEYDEEARIWQRDVNNYIVTKASWDGKLDWSKTLRYGKDIKLCGGWLQYTAHRTGYPELSSLTGHVAAKAAIEYLLCGKDVVNFIVKHDKLMDFIVFCKKGPGFRDVVQRMADGSEVLLHRANRVYASKNLKYGQIFKRKYRKDKQGVEQISYNKISNVPDNCIVINQDILEMSLSEIKKDIDYMYYISKAVDLLDIDWVDVNLKPINKYKYE